MMCEDCPEASEKLCDGNDRDSYVRASLLSRLLMPKLDNKSQYKFLRIVQNEGKREQ